MSASGRRPNVLIAPSDDLGVKRRTQNLKAGRHISP
jgi:hypothetical protein